jgi:hypothetical protein
MRNAMAGLAALFATATVAQAGIIGTVTAGGYVFTNFDLPNAGTNAAAGTNINGISNSGDAVGVSIDNNGNFQSFIRHPDGTTTQLPFGAAGMAFGINSADNVVGQDNGAAVFVPKGGSEFTLTVPPNTANGFGINELGNIVGQFETGNGTPGFFLTNAAAQNFTQINAPRGPNVVNAQGINDNGLVVGFYAGTDGQVHGFDVKIPSGNPPVLTGTAISDPTIPNVAGEPGATFVFSQILGINDNGLAAGYYGDSTTSQHGYFYNTLTGTYTFLDDPAESFNNGVEVTQITGINNMGEISGFYSDANGVFHGFVGCPAGVSCAAPFAPPAPEPDSLMLAGLGCGVLGFVCYGRRRRARA